LVGTAEKYGGGCNGKNPWTFAGATALTAATRPGEASPRRRKRALGLLARITAGGLALLALALAAGALLPVPSTLMLWRFATGESVTRIWVPLDRISPELVRAVIAAEDQNFCSHSGIDWGALREVLNDEDGPTRGGSTISMQTVKNVYLWHGRSYVRKGLELPLALAADLAWSKHRMMEVYLNVAEFGEGLFGVEAASRRYFGKPAAALTRREAAALAAALPNPRLRNPALASPRARTNGLRIHSRIAALGERAQCALRASGP
jgi:monofunctional biosynthetic peptidoglycan transglycosylase